MPRHIILVLFTLLFQFPALGQKISPDGTATYYYFPQRKKSEGKLINGQREGVWTFYNIDGKVTGTETYANNQMNGRCLYYHVSNGVLWTEGDCKDNKRDGLWKYYFANGKPSGSEVYKEGLMDGPAEYYDPVSNTRIAEGQHVNNRRDGVWRFYYMYTGKLKAEENYKGNLHGLSIYYDSTTGKKKSEGNYRNGKMHGDWTYYDSLTGAIKMIEPYEDGVPEGNAMFHDEGNTTVRGRIVNGQRDGVWKKYNEKGTLIEESSFVNGNLDGQIKTYYPSGTIESVGQVVNNEPHGEMKFYDSATGKLKMIMMHNKGMQERMEHYDIVTGARLSSAKIKNESNKTEWEIYNADNRLIERKYFVDGNEIRSIEYHSEKGYVTADGGMLNDMKEGEWKYYNAQGQIYLIEHYKADQLHGNLKEIHNEDDITAEYSYNEGLRNGHYQITTDGYKWIEGTYFNDSLHGPHYVYYPSGKIKRSTFFNYGVGVTDSCFDENGELVTPYPFMQKSYFKGNVMTYIGDNLRYPAAAKQKGLEGKVLVRFTINESGRVSDVSVQKSAHPELDAEAVRLVSQMPPWQPLQMDRKRLRSHKTLPIVFWIPDSDKK